MSDETCDWRIAISADKEHDLDHVCTGCGKQIVVRLLPLLGLPLLFCCFCGKPITQANSLEEKS